MKHTSHITLPFILEREAKAFIDDDNRYPESLVRYFLKNYTKKGDRVFDPFAGLGTTLFVAEEMGRTGYGIEADIKRYEWAAGQLENWNHLVWDDSALMLKHDFPKMDFVMTSPPFMPKNHKWNPLYGGDPDKAGYDIYLKRMGHIFGKMKDLVKRNAYVVVQLDNIQQQIFTPLVWDAGNQIAKHFRLDAEIIVKWDKAKKDYPHTHCLVFKNTRQ